MTRDKARDRIVQAANRFRVKLGQRRTPPYAPPLYSRRQLQRAVSVVRHNRLVKPEVLMTAGFNTKGRNA